MNKINLNNNECLNIFSFLMRFEPLYSNQLQMYWKLFFAWIFVIVITPINACRHDILPFNTSLTLCEILLLLFVPLFLTFLCILVPLIAKLFCEIREMNAERRRRFHAYRKIQCFNRTQVHVPTHFLRNYYEQKRRGFKSSSAESTQRVQHLI